MNDMLNEATSVDGELETESGSTCNHKSNSGSKMKSKSNRAQAYEKEANAAENEFDEFDSYPEYADYIDSQYCIFKANKRICLAVTNVNITGCETNQIDKLERKLIKFDSEFPEYNLLRRNNEKLGPSFIKAGGYQKNGVFSWCYALLLNRLLIMSKEIKCIGKDIKFINGVIYKRPCFANNIYVWEKCKVNSSGIYLPLDCLFEISTACDDWDKLFRCKDGALKLKKGESKKSLGLLKVSPNIFFRGDDKFDTNIDGIASISNYWQYPVVFDEYTRWDGI